MNRLYASARILALAAMFTLSLASPGAAAIPSLRTIAITGQQAPDAPPGVVFSALGTAGLNNSGQVAFEGVLAGAGVTPENKEGIWSDAQTGALALSIRAGDQAPGLPAGVRILDFDSLHFNNPGRIAVRSRLVGSGVTASNGRAIFAERSTGIELVMRSGGPAPAPYIGTASIFGGLLFNDADQTAFVGEVVTSSAPGGIDAVFSEGSGALRTVFTTSGSLGFNLSQHFNDAGHVVTSSPDSLAIWSDRSGDMQIIVAENDPAPGTPPGVTFFSLIDRAALNDHDQIAFKASLHNTPDPPNDSSGIWSEGLGQGLALVARAGAPAPGVPDAVFRTFDAPVLNSSGETAFMATLGGPGAPSGTTSSVWSERGGQLGMVARAGEPAPGVIDGAVFSAFSPFPALNGAGQTLFRGFLTGPTITTLNREGIWAQDRAGNLTLIAREGDPLDVDDGPGVDLRIIERLETGTNFGNEDGFGSTFNDFGQISFFAEFVDGSMGLFLSNAATVPEPSTLALVLLSFLAIGRPRPSR